MEKTIIDFLNDYMKKADGGIAAGGADRGSDGSGRLISFHMPGHKGRSELYEKTGYETTEAHHLDRRLRPDRRHHDARTQAHYRRVQG